MLTVDGWHLFAHPLFLDQLEKLVAAVERARAKDTEGYRNAADSKLLAALRKLVFETILDDPTRAEYRQRKTLGGARKHWFRAKFGGQRFRLFFRYDSRARIIIFAWVNDQSTLRAYGSRTDAYSVFQNMLDKGNPPEDWEILLAEASQTTASDRLKQMSGSASGT